MPLRRMTFNRARAGPGACRSRLRLAKQADRNSQKEDEDAQHDGA